MLFTESRAVRSGLFASFAMVAACMMVACGGEEQLSSAQPADRPVTQGDAASASGEVGDSPSEPATDTTMALPDDADPAAVHMLATMETTDAWEAMGDIDLSLSDDATEGESALMLTGSGHIQLKPGVLEGVDLARFDRIVMDVKILDGHVTDIGMVTHQFPQTADVNFPRWAKYDESTPSGQWLEWSADLSIYEWPGGNAEMVYEQGPALSIIYVPGKGNTAVLIDNVRLVADPIRLGYDWVEPISPLLIVQRSPHGIYEKATRVRNATDQPVDLAVRFSADSLQQFSGDVSPATVTLAPGQEQVVTARIETPANADPLAHELQTLEFIPNADPRLIQRKTFITAAPFPKVEHPFTLDDPAKQKSAVADADRMLTMLPDPVVLPAYPARWISQSVLNTYYTWKRGDEGHSFAGFDRLKNNATGEIREADNITGPVFHRWYVQKAAPTLGLAYQQTGDEKYAAAVRDIALAYAREYHKYGVDEPLNEASSYLSPNNATYTLGTVIMAPVTRALDLVWESASFTPEVKREVTEGFLLPAVLEMQKINPGMTNMQDAMNEAMFNIGLLTNDPNIVAHTLFGDHGLNAKINTVFDEDGATPESVSPGYHNAALDPVLKQVASLRSSGLEVEIAFDRLEKAKTLMDQLRMPDGRIPNRGDSGFPAGGSPPPDSLGSVSFEHYGMTVLREPDGRDGVYIAMDHRPPSLTHSHKDKLSITLYGKGEYLGVDDGSLYNTDTNKQNKDADWATRSAWGVETLAHNTITVDEQSMAFGGGERLYFHGEPGEYQAVVASTDNVYRGVTIERSIVLLDGVIVMVDRCLSDESHTYDWTHHSFGELTGPSGLEPVEKLGETGPYALAADPKWGRVEGPIEFVWRRENASLRLMSLPLASADTQVGSAIGWSNKAYQQARMPAPFAVVRQTGRNATFVTVFEPFKGESTIASAEVGTIRMDGAAQSTDKGLGVEVRRTDGRVTHFLIAFTDGEAGFGPITTSERCYAVTR